MIVFIGRIADLNRLTSEYEQSQETIIALTATTGALATEVVRAGSDVAVAEWAYGNRKWIREGDRPESLGMRSTRPPGGPHC